MKYGLIYKIINLTNGKIYIGQTTRSLEKRWREHINFSKNDINLPFYNSIRNTGALNFKIEVLGYFNNQAELNLAEIYYIKHYQSLIIYNRGYNLNLGGNNGKHSNFTKEKISKKNTGRKSPMKGKTWEQFYGEKRAVVIKSRRMPQKGKTLPEEHKKKIAIGLKKHLNSRLENLYNSRYLIETYLKDGLNLSIIYEKLQVTRGLFNLLCKTLGVSVLNSRSRKKLNKVNKHRKRVISLYFRKFNVKEISIFLNIKNKLVLDILKIHNLPKTVDKQKKILIENGIIVEVKKSHGSLGKKFSEEHKRKISESNTGRRGYNGENNPNFKHKENEKEIITLYKKNTSINKISEILNLDWGYVKRRIKAFEQ